MVGDTHVRIGAYMLATPLPSSHWHSRMFCEGFKMKFKVLDFEVYNA